MPRNDSRRTSMLRVGATNFDRAQPITRNHNVPVLAQHFSQTKPTILQDQGDRYRNLLGVLIRKGDADIGLWADIDAVGPGRKAPPETLCPSVRDADRIGEDFNRLYVPLRLGLVISSGHGCYPSLLFREPFVISTPEDRNRLEYLGRQFHAALYKIAANRGWTSAVDYCDLAKVIRLPGSVNFKDPDHPEPVRISSEYLARFDPTEIRELLPPTAANPSLTKPLVQVSTATKDLTVPKLLIEYLCMDWQFRRRWAHSTEGLADKSCTGIEASIAGLCVARGLPDQVIAAILVAFTLGIREKSTSAKERN